MEQQAAKGGKGARKASNAQPARKNATAEPAAAPKGQGKRPDPGEAKARASPANKGKGATTQAGKDDPPSGRQTSLKKSAGAAKSGAGDPAGKSPAEDKAALPPLKQERRPKAKASQAGKAEVASGETNAVPKEEEPERERREAAPRGKKAPAREPAAKAEQPAEPGKAAGPRARGASRRSLLGQVLQRLVLRRRAVEDASQRVNTVRDLLLRAVKKKACFSTVEIMGTGSYYEHLKIKQPDEFDIMLKVPDVRAVLESYDCAYKDVYYFVNLSKRQPALQALKDFVDDQQRLPASSILSALRTIITDEVKTMNGMMVTVETEKPGSPAVTLRIGEPPSHISVDIILALEIRDKSQKNRRDVKEWLGAKANKDLCKEWLYLVPKNVKVGDKFTDTWRLSFSHIEKNIIKDHGNTKTCCQGSGEKCCRKDCLKLLKYLLEQLKTKHEDQFEDFCSYHAKTAFLHTCLNWPKDDQWLNTHLDECFKRLLDYFLDCLRKAKLEHFFIPECNLFGADLKCSVLAKVIENERTNGFPIFKET